MAILQDTLLESEEVTLSPQPLFDLHSHTTASDGLLSSAELVSRAAEMGVTTLAITDHDTTAGIPAARQAIVEQELELELIAGVEISTLWENHEIHIVGLNVDIDSAELQTLLSEQVTRRQARAKEIALRLEKARIPGALEGATRIAMVLRSHVVTLPAILLSKAMQPTLGVFSNIILRVVKPVTLRLSGVQLKRPSLRFTMRVDRPWWPIRAAIS